MPTRGAQFWKIGPGVVDLDPVEDDFRRFGNGFQRVDAFLSVSTFPNLRDRTPPTHLALGDAGGTIPSSA